MTYADDDAARSNGEERRVAAPDTATTETKPHRPFIPHFIRIFAIPIILAWVARDGRSSTSRSRRWKSSAKPTPRRWLPWTHRR